MTAGLLTDFDRAAVDLTIGCLSKQSTAYPALAKLLRAYEALAQQVAELEARLERQQAEVDASVQIALDAGSRAYEARRLLEKVGSVERDTPEYIDAVQAWLEEHS